MAREVKSPYDPDEGGNLLPQVESPQSETEDSDLPQHVVALFGGLVCTPNNTDRNGCT